MMTTVIVCLIAGIALGQRFKVLILLPAISLALIAIAGTGLAHADDGWSIAWRCFAAATGLQLGYLAGPASDPSSRWAARRAR